MTWLEAAAELDDVDEQLQQLRRETRDQPRKTSGRGSAGAAGRTDGRPSAPGIAPGHSGPAKAPISEMADVGHAPQEAQMSTGDERLDAVEDRIDEAKEAADRVEDNEGLGLRHRETDQHGTFEPPDDERAGENEPGARRGSPGRGLGAVTAEPAVLSRARARRRRRG